MLYCVLRLAYYIMYYAFRLLLILIQTTRKPLPILQGFPNFADNKRTIIRIKWRTTKKKC